MRFPFTEEEVGESPAFPHRSTVLRPYVTVHLSLGTVRLGTLAVVDSGADFCLFPASWAHELGIQVPNVRWAQFKDAAGNPRLAYFDQVELSIADPYTHDDVFSFQANVGFSPELEEDGVAYLGNDGFFSECYVGFHSAEGFFEIEKKN